jgi:Tfp pilus assembly protein PilZ
MERDSVLPLRLIVSGEKVDIETRVAACTPIAGERRKAYGIGLEFTQIRSEVQDKIRHILTELTGRPQGG